MDNIVIKPSKLSGSITPPSSKSMSHRAIICASLCEGTSIIKNVILSEDIKATIEGMSNLGAHINVREIQNNKIYSLLIRGSKGNIKDAVINCKESGSTLRFLIPLGLVLSNGCHYKGTGKLTERPLSIYYDIFDEQNIKYKNTDGKLPLSVYGKLSHGSYNVSGNVSSQFISGLLFALPLLEKNSIINITDNLESEKYIDLTLNMLETFGVHVKNEQYKKLTVCGGSKYKAASYTVENDYSQAAFFLVAKALGNDVECLGLNEDSLQGDKEIINIIENFKQKQEITIDASHIPDLIPIAAVLGALQNNKTTRIINAGRLRIKESDRLKAITTELNKIGANVEELSDGLLIKGNELLDGNNIVRSWNDHRIAMSLAIAATKCKQEIILENYKAVNKSYPEFWNDYKYLGGEVHELCMGK